jgi:hypothetical protein
VIVGVRTGAIDAVAQPRRWRASMVGRMVGSASSGGRWRIRG